MTQNRSGDPQGVPADLRKLLEGLAAEGISATLPNATAADPLPEPLVVRTSLSSAVIEERIESDEAWFDHPEMQARIEKAELDRLEGRVERFDSRESALAYFGRVA